MEKNKQDITAENTEVETETEEKKLLRKKYSIDDPELKLMLHQPQKSKDVLAAFFNYKKEEPRTLESVDLVFRK